MRLSLRVAAALIALSPLACTAQPAAFVEGTHYKEVRNPSAPSDPSKVEVTEVFWYGCPHCFHLDPYIERWRKSKPADVNFRRLPTSLGRPEGVLHSKAYFTAEQLGILDQFHPAFFATMHEQHVPMMSEASIATVFARFGIGEDKFKKTFDGFAVDSQVRRAEQQVREYGITSVPTVIVGGRWYSTVGMAGSEEEFLKVIDFLVDKARSEQKK